MWSAAYPQFLFLSSPNFPRCSDRRRISFPTSSFSCDLDCSDSDSFIPAFSSSFPHHDVKRGTQIFCPCPPRSLVLVSPSSAGRFFAPYQQGEAGICAPSNTWFSQVADEDASDTESVANRNICSCLRRGQIHVRSFMCILSRN